MTEFAKTSFRANEPPAPAPKNTGASNRHTPTTRLPSTPWTGNQSRLRDSAPPIERKKQSPPQESFALNLAGITIQSRSQLVLYLKVFQKEVSSDLHGVDSPDLKEKANLWLSEASVRIETSEGAINQPFSRSEETQLHAFFDEGVQIRQSVAAYKELLRIKENSARLRQARDNADHAAEELKHLMPLANRKARWEFTHDNESNLSQALEWTNTITDIGMGMHEFSEQATEFLAQLTEVEAGVETKSANSIRLFTIMKRQAVLPDFDSLAFHRWAHAIDLLNRGLTIINLARSIKGAIQEKKTTELERGVQLTKLAADTFTASTTLLNMAPSIGLMMNVSIIPQLKIVVVQLEKLTEDFHEQNEQWKDFDEESINWHYEVGGDARTAKVLYYFMKQLMHADNEADIPPIPKPVAQFLMDHRELIGAGLRDELKTSGVLWWRKFKAAQLKTLLFNNRAKLWAMFYGDWTVPD